MTSRHDSAHKPTRRQFVQTAAAASAAFGFPTIVPSTVFGDDKPSDRVNIGLIGCGKQMAHHIGRLTGSPGNMIVAVCDVDKTRREHRANMVTERYKKFDRAGFKGVEIYDDYRQVLAREDIDAVLIATPDHWHAIPIIEACKAKKDIYCEKPLTLTIHEAKTVIDAARKYKIVFQTGSQQRSEGPFHKAVETIRNGRLGKIKEVIVDVGGPSKWCDLKEEEMEPGLDWDTWLGPAPKRPYSSVLAPRGVHNHYPAWRNYREYSGGMMTDWGAHHFDITQWGLGMDEAGPSTIIPPDDPKSGRGVKFIYPKTPVGDNVTVIHGKSGGVEFRGELGSINVNRGHIRSNPESILKEPLGDDKVTVFKSPGHHQNWLDCIKTRQKPICDVEVGARSVTVCHLGNLAYWNGKTMNWDAHKWAFTDDTPGDWLDRERREPFMLPSI